MDYYDYSDDDEYYGDYDGGRYARNGYSDSDLEYDDDEIYI